MRKTRLRQTSVSVAVILIAMAALFAALRVLVIHPPELPAGDGATLFSVKGCADCHYTKSRETKIGPGLKELFERKKLPVSRRKVTEKNVRTQLEMPYENMPSFADRLTEEQREMLIAYLKSL